MSTFCAPSLSREIAHVSGLAHFRQGGSSIPPKLTRHLQRHALLEIELLLEDGDSDCLASDDGTLMVLFHRLPEIDGGLFVKRIELSRQGGRPVVRVRSLIIRSGPDYDRWCDMDPLRFEHPHLSNQLRRIGHDVLGPTS